MARKVKKIPHLFGKLVVIFCIAISFIFSVWAFILLRQGVIGVAETLTAVLLFFGGELLASALRSAFKERGRKSDEV